MKRALIVRGGWDGHEPVQTADLIAESLRKNQFEVEIADTLDAFKDVERLMTFDVLMPHWTMGAIAKEPLNGLLEAVKSGVGVGGIHGGMGDAFREACGFQWMVGGQFVSHPGNSAPTYTVNIVDRRHPITKGIEDFQATSEQYYMHVDPSNQVLATTTFEAERVPGGRDVVMPVTWIRMYHRGRVFYTSVGHNAAVVKMPPVLTMITRGLMWAAGVL